MEQEHFKCVYFWNGRPPKSGPVVLLSKFGSMYLKTYKGFDVADYIFEIYIQNTVGIVICRGLRLLLQDW